MSTEDGIVTVKVVSIPSEAGREVRPPSGVLLRNDGDNVSIPSEAGREVRLRCAARRRGGLHPVSIPSEAGREVRQANTRAWEAAKAVFQSPRKRGVR